MFILYVLIQPHPSFCMFQVFSPQTQSPLANLYQHLQSYQLKLCKVTYSLFVYLPYIALELKGSTGINENWLYGLSLRNLLQSLIFGSISYLTSWKVNSSFSFATCFESK